MPESAAPRPHVSQNRVQGSLEEASIDDLIEACFKHLVTGTLAIHAEGERGIIELRAGAVESAVFGQLDGHNALEKMSQLDDGEYEFVQKLPNLDGELGDAAAFEGDVSDVPLVDVMRHCEDNALSCIVEVTAGQDVSQIHYRTGEIDQVVFNGERDDDRIVDLLGYENAHFRVSAPPLDLDIAGWPQVREPTAPFRIVGDRLEQVPPNEKIHKEPEPAEEPAARAEPEPEPERAQEPEPKKAEKKSKKGKLEKKNKKKKRSRKQTKADRLAEKKAKRAETDEPTADEPPPESREEEKPRAAARKRPKSVEPEGPAPSKEELVKRFIQPAAQRRDDPEDEPRSTMSVLVVVGVLAVFAALWGYVLVRVMSN